MKKVLSVLLATVLSITTSISALADPEPDTPAEPELIEEYQYTSSISNDLSISNYTASCLSTVFGFSGLATKIEVKQTLQRQIGSSWDYVASWDKTFNSWYAIYNTTKSSLVSGTYRLRTIAKVYSGSNYETIKVFSYTVTC